MRSVIQPKRWTFCANFSKSLMLRFLQVHNRSDQDFQFQFHPTRCKHSYNPLSSRSIIGLRNELPNGRRNRALRIQCSLYPMAFPCMASVAISPPSSLPLPLTLCLSSLFSLSVSQTFVCVYFSR